MSWWPILLKAGHLAHQAVEADEQKDYVKALKLYEKCEGYFCYAIKNEAPTDETKEAIRNKLKLYQDRAEFLRSYLEKHGFLDTRKNAEGNIEKKDLDTTKNINI